MTQQAEFRTKQGQSTELHIPAMLLTHPSMDFDLPHGNIALRGFGLAFESVLPEKFEMQLERFSLIRVAEPGRLVRVHRKAEFFPKGFYREEMEGPRESRTAAGASEKPPHS